MAKKIEINQEVLEARKIIDRLVEEYKGEEKRKAELEALYQARIDEIEHVYNEKSMSIDINLARIKGQIQGYYGIAEPKETKTQSKLGLLSGEVVVKKEDNKLDYDKSKLLEWAKENGRLDLINTKVTEDFKWAEFKSGIEIQASEEEIHILDTTTGEMLEIDGLGVVVEPEKMVIK